MAAITTPTPETLRGHAAYYRERDDFGDEGLAEIFDAAADALEEKEQLLDKVNDRLAALEPKLDRIQRNTDLIIVERDDYRKRLAKAEDAIRDAHLWFASAVAYANIVEAHPELVKQMVEWMGDNPATDAALERGFRRDNGLAALRPRADEGLPMTTPETLKQDANKLAEYAARFTGDGQEPDMFGILSEKMLASADAWEQCENNFEELAGVGMKLDGENQHLREQLAASESARQRAETALREIGPDSLDINDRVKHIVRAALAPKETP